MMVKHSYIPALLGFFGVAMVLDLVISLSVGLFCWALGAGTSNAYSIGLFLVGATALSLCGATIVYQARGAPDPYMSASDGIIPPSRDRSQNCAMLAFLTMVGFGTIALGFLLRVMFK
jgi:hypothetical protein